MKELAFVVSLLKLVIRYFGYNGIAKIKTLEVGHHTNFSPVIIIHLTTDFQTTNILNVLNMI